MPMELPQKTPTSHYISMEVVPICPENMRAKLPARQPRELECNSAFILVYPW